ncbi:MAG TPA: 1-acyl-sn-glycerol-3-phosphate acyltransferase [Gaiellaceae bacterium]|nr:1-acyl-sn-glycerol-3-phosphate acyltransferase [Gaiellaceae bacterium]
MPDLYDAVAYGMRTYSAVAFRVDLLGPRRFPLEPGTMVVVTHRRETDVPILCPPLYFGSGGVRNRANRLHFAARDDMFLPGFFAGFPPDLPAWARRALYPVGVARWLPVVNVFPIRSARVARLGEVLAARPDAALDDVLPEEGEAAFRARAAEAGTAAPARAGDALDGRYADLLWRPVSPGDGVRDGLEDFWSGRAAQAAGDFRTLVELVRARKTLVVFPEGRPSPDGEIGPIRPGIGALVRRGKPVAVRPLALAYDPLVRGRARVHLALGEPEAPPSRDVEVSLLDRLRRTMPLTCGQVVAARLAAGAEADPPALLRHLDDAVESALAEGRPVERDLVTAAGRRERLGEALAVAARHAAELPFLAREHESARQPAHEAE